MLSEIRQTTKDKYWMILLICGLEKAKIAEIASGRVVASGGQVGKGGDDGQRVETPSRKMNRFLGANEW